MGNNGPESSRDVLRGIDWPQAFPFTQLFRTFRLAIHPSKLLLALAAVLICYVGGRFLDLFAPNAVVVGPMYTVRMPPDEIQQYLDAATTGEFFRWRERARRKNREELARMLVLNDVTKKLEDARESVRQGKALGELRAEWKLQRTEALELLNKRYKATRKIIKAEYDRVSKTGGGRAYRDYRTRLKDLEDARNLLQISILKSTKVASLVIKDGNPRAAIQKLVRSDPEAKDRVKDKRDVEADSKKLLSAVQLADSYERAKAIQGLGVFQAALSYGILMFNSAVDSVLQAKLFFNQDFKGFTPDNTAPPGLVNTLGLTVRGLGWFVRVHYIYFIIYGLFTLAVWSVAGGAICRIAALHAARDEKIPLKEAIGFARKKFANFFFAPLMPVLFILGCCVPLLIAGLIGAIPVVGELIVGIPFIILLAIGFVLALLIVGALAGIGLAYPTIAAEGSDAFDAFSRSYSYVYARPWRTIFYTLVTAIYGTLCFIFVKLFAWLILGATSTIVGVLMNRLADATHAAPLGKLEAMWFSPSFSGPFFGRFFLFELTWSQSLASFFIALWVFTFVVGPVIAFAISFFFSGYTLIYLLLRQRVDATEFDDVYVEEFEEEGSTLGPAEPGAVEQPAPTEGSEPGKTQPPADTPEPPQTEDKGPPEGGETDTGETPQQT